MFPSDGASITEPIFFVRNDWEIEAFAGAEKFERRDSKPVWAPPGGCRKCGKQRTCGRAFLEVWQLKDLQADFADLWQIQDLAVLLQRAE